MAQASLAATVDVTPITKACHQCFRFYATNFGTGTLKVMLSSAIPYEHLKDIN